MKHLISLLSLVFAMFAAAADVAIPFNWIVETTKVNPASFEAYQGETLVFTAELQSRGKPLAVPENYSFYWQTNGMGSAYWVTNAAPVVHGMNMMRALWLPEFDVGASCYNCFIGKAGSIYHAAFQLRLRPSPGARPGYLPLPRQKIDFAAVEIVNPSAAPWLMSETDPTVPAWAKEPTPPVTVETDPIWSAEKSGYQPKIDDIDAIRAGAALGATAVQPAAISDMETRTHAADTYQPKGSYLTTETDPTVPAWAKNPTPPVTVETDPIWSADKPGVVAAIAANTADIAANAAAIASQSSQLSQMSQSLVSVSNAATNARSKTDLSVYETGFGPWTDPDGVPDYMTHYEDGMWWGNDWRPNSTPWEGVWSAYGSVDDTVLDAERWVGPFPGGEMVRVVMRRSVVVSPTADQLAKTSTVAQAEARLMNLMPSAQDWARWDAKVGYYSGDYLLGKLGSDMGLQCTIDPGGFWSVMQGQMSFNIAANGPREYGYESSFVFNAYGHTSTLYPDGSPVATSNMVEGVVTDATNATLQAAKDYTDAHSSDASSITDGTNTIYASGKTEIVVKDISSLTNGHWVCDGSSIFVYDSETESDTRWTEDPVSEYNRREIYRQTDGSFAMFADYGPSFFWNGLDAIAHGEYYGQEYEMTVKWIEDFPIYKKTQSELVTQDALTNGANTVGGRVKSLENRGNTWDEKVGYVNVNEMPDGNRPDGIKGLLFDTGESSFSFSSHGRFIDLRRNRWGVMPYDGIDNFYAAEFRIDAGYEFARQDWGFIFALDGTSSRLVPDGSRLLTENQLQSADLNLTGDVKINGTNLVDFIRAVVGQ